MLGLIILNSYAFIILLFICAVFFSKDRQHKFEDKTYGVFLIINIFVILSGLLLGLAINNYDYVDGNILKILNKIYVMFLCLWMTILSYYVIYIAYVKEDKNKLSRISKIISVSTIIILILTMIFPISIEINENSAMATGLAVTVPYIYAAISFSAQLIFIIIDKKNITNKKYIPVYMLILIAALIVGLMIYDPTLNYLINPATTFVTIIMYHTIENPDMKMVTELEVAKDSADKANQAKSEFLSNMSHEIRTPLNAIVGFSEALKYDDLNEDSMSKVNDIIMASNNLLEIVNGILDISKIEANKIEIIDKEYDIHSMIDELIALTKARIGDKGLEFNTYIDPTIPAVLYGDNTRVKQVVLNLLTNAVKYTKQGHVDFKVSTIQKDNICRLIFSVEDTGIGIKEESIPNLFSKFDRLGVEKQMTIEGTGLGLAITKKLVDLMNGKIVVQSEYGKGSKFTVSIDQRIVSITKPSVKEAKVSESKVINAKGAHALIVDDNDLNIKVATTLLTKYGFIVDSATNGLECISKVTKPNDYEIVFLDDMMPRMSGRDTIKRLRLNPEYKIPTVALTANAIEGMKEEYLQCGFDDYLSKPIDKLELERVIKKYIHKANVEDSNTKPSDNAQSIIEMDFELPALSMDVVKKNTLQDQPQTIDYTGKTLLLVDDNEMNLKVAEMILKKYNFNLTKCQSGQEAINIINENKSFDIILLDEMMPGMDGCTTLDNLRQIEGFNIPTIMMTASPRDEVAIKLEEHNFNGYVGKPINKESLEKILAQILNK